MNTDTDLHLIFKNAAGNNVFTSTGGDLVEAVEGYLRTTTTDKISA